MKILDANGARIPALGFGTWQLRGDTCRDLVAHALDAGYRHIDTAIMYGNEREVGAGMRASDVARDAVFVTTKVWPDEIGDGALQLALEGSLERLGLDAVDLVLVHWPSRDIPFAETAQALEDVQARGLAVNVGVSNFTIRQIEEAASMMSVPLVCNQIEHHPYLDQTPLRRACASHGIAIIGYCPLFKGGELFTEPAVLEAASAHRKSPAQIVLRWHMQQDGCGAIPKTATPARAPENLDVFDFELDREQLAAITALREDRRRIADFEFSPEWDASPYDRAA